MVDLQSKKMCLPGIGHEMYYCYQDVLSFSKFLENPSMSLTWLWSDGTNFVLFWGGCSFDGLHGNLCKVPLSL